MVSWTKHVIPIVILTVGIYYYYFIFSPIYGPIVQTKSGQVRGILSKSRGGKEYYSYLGVPYGKPPENDLRFEDPQPVSKWEGVLTADRLGPECLQLEVLVVSKVVGQENCLMVNIFTPKPQSQKEDKRYPVLVYLHGGLFMGGSSNFYRANYLLDENIVLVTLNYRVGALGFLSTGDGLIRGNQGLKDQSLALKFVKENIEAFGGDSNQITLFGESAGGASVHFHLISPMSKGLFTSAISMSGSAIRKYESTLNKIDQVKYFGQKFGCVSQIPAELVSCLKKVDGNVLVEGHRDASEAIPSNEFILFVPTTEVIDDNKAFLARYPRDMIESGNFTNVPWATGVVAMEGLLYVARIVREPGAMQRISENWLQVLPTLLKYDAKNVETTRKIKEFYFGNDVNLDMKNNIHKFSDMFSDRLFIHPTFVAAKIQSKYSKVYLYYLTYKPKTSAYDLITAITPNGPIPAPLEFIYSLIKKWIQKNILGIHIPTYGPSHGDELSLLFNMHFLVNISPEHPDYEFSKVLVKLFADFAKNENSVEFNGHKWKPVTHEDSILKYLEINVNGTFMTHPENEDIVRRLNFWDKLNLPFS